MMEKDDEIICDRCRNFRIHPSGVNETCDAQRINSVASIWIDDEYKARRMNGEIRQCKGFKKLIERAERWM